MTVLPAIHDDLIGVVGPQHVREAVAADAIDGVMPRWVVAPGTATEAGGILSLANDAGLAVAPRGSGTALGLGNPPERLDLVLSTHRMDRVLEHAAGDLVARLEAGVRLADAQEVFARAGQWLPLDPPDPDATIGGIIATNASGPHRLRYGTMRDLLIGITYVLSDGTIAKAGGKVVKNVAGYDLCKLFTGSLGTLGLITEAIVRLHPLPAASRTVRVLITGGDFSELDAMSAAILASTLVPASIAFGPGEVAVLFEGIEPSVEAQAAKASELLRPYGEPAVLDGGQAAALWRSIRQPWRKSGGRTARLTIGTLPATTGPVMVGLMQFAPAAVTGFGGTGTIRLELDGDASMLIDQIGSIRQMLRGREAHVVVTYAPPEVKREIDVWGDAGDSLPLMRRVKERFDPNRTLNPGRFVGGI